MEHTQKITTVLFDLDGTLLPMELELFMKDYFQRLSQKMNLCGYDGNAVLDNIGKGIHAIHTNKSSRLNEEIFWESLSTAYKKEEASKLKDIFEEFYRVEFQAVQNVLMPKKLFTSAANMDLTPSLPPLLCSRLLQLAAVCAGRALIPQISLILQLMKILPAASPPRNTTRRF